jgi:hypothetical protein
MRLSAHRHWRMPRARGLRRTALLVGAPAGVDVRSWPAVIDTDEEFYFKPDAARLLLSPAWQLSEELVVHEAYFVQAAAL